MEMRYFGTESLILSGRMYASITFCPNHQVRCEHFPDIVHVDLHLEIMLDVMIHHLQQVDERARVVICAVDSSHFVIHVV